MINNRDILQYKSKLIVEYALLDERLIDHPDLQIRLDNVHNLYAYSDKVKLLDTFDMMLTNYNINYNDLYIRLLHYVAVQHGLFTNTRTVDDQIIRIIDNIKSLLVGICKEVIQGYADINLLPTYLKEFYENIMNITGGVKWQI